MCVAFDIGLGLVGTMCGVGPGKEKDMQWGSQWSSSSLGSHNQHMSFNSIPPTPPTVLYFSFAWSHYCFFVSERCCDV